MSPKSFNKLLVPTDFSDLSVAALEYVQSFSTFRKSTIYLMHVVESVPMLAFPAAGADPEAVMVNAVQDAKSDLEKFIREKVRSLENVVPVIHRGVPYREITQFAKSASVDLIVIATHGRTGVAHAIMGSVAEKVVRHSTVPVLTIKPAEIRNSNLRESDVDEQLHILH